MTTEMWFYTDQGFARDGDMNILRLTMDWKSDSADCHEQFRDQGYEQRATFGDLDSESAGAEVWERVRGDDGPAFIVTSWFGGSGQDIAVENYPALLLLLKDLSGPIIAANLDTIRERLASPERRR